jgi:hypothetical protein
MVVFAFKQISRFAPAAAAGNGFTVTVTLLLLVQPVAVMVSVTSYVVVTVGETVGLARVEVNPAGLELQLYVLPETAVAPILALAFRQIVLLLPAAATGNGFTVTVTLFEFVHPVAVMVSTTV